MDLAKNVFVVCVADAVGRVSETREFNRAGFLAWLATLPRGAVVDFLGNQGNQGQTTVSANSP